MNRKKINYSAHGSTKSTRSIRTKSKSTSEGGVVGPGRILLVAVVFAIGALCVVVRAGQLQLVDHEKYEGVVERQATLSASINAKRGVIKDRHGAELAITVDVDTVYAEPKKIDPSEKATVARELARVLGQPEKAVAAKLSKDRSFVYLKRRVDPQTAEKVRALKKPGIGTQPEPKRFYANRGLAAHVLGFSGEGGDGRAGIEKQLEAELRGKSYEMPGLRDAFGKKVLKEGFVPHAVLEGADVTLTIDRQVQFAAESALANAVTQAKARAGMAVVLEAKSGDVLAMASMPTFNPNNLKGATPDHQMNRVVNAVFEPGSTMKLVTIAGALEDKLLGPEDRVDCEKGSMRIGRRTIGDSHKGYGELTIAEIMKVSSNVCSAKIGLQMGAERLHHWMKAFGMGEKTGIELPGELRGLLRPWSAWREIAIANIAFGQGLSATPLQIAQAAATIANGGMRVAPRLVAEVVDKSGRKISTERPAPVRVLSEETASAVRRMMEEVTKKGGTAENAAIPGFAVAGKTGTAQKIDPVSKAYSHELYVSSFVGFVPADAPEIVILVMIDEPKGAYYGGTVAAPAFRQIALAALASREVFPDDAATREAFLASYRPIVPEAAPVAEAAEGEGEIEGQTIESKQENVGIELALSAEAQALLDEKRAEPKDEPQLVAVAAKADRGSDRGRMPNFAGLKLDEVLNRSAEVECDPLLTGSGRVISQSPPAGAMLQPGARCELKLGK
jgi:cell division protein FtsI (penicillin-binding protein 3)